MQYQIVCDAKNIITIDNKLILNDELQVDINKLQPDVRCAPDKKYSCGSCMTVRSVLALVVAYNKYMRKNNINKSIQLKYDVSDDEDGEKVYKKYLLKQLTLAMKGVCNDQLCWLKQEFIKELSNEDKEEILEKTFRPSGPTGQFKWLATNNTDDVMKQYEKEYPEFKYLGTVPIDFDDLSDERRLSEINYNDLSKTKSKIGVIFNLDRHYEKGSHWVGLFADLNSGNINFYDSYGIKPDKRINALIKVIASDCLQRNINPKIQHNTNRHQFKDSECGVYSINFIARSLAGHSFEEIVADETNDETVNKCRKVYFNNTMYKV